MRRYVDTSVALHAILPGGDERATAWFDSACAAGDELFSSALLELELVRALRRERLDLGIRRAVLDRVDVVSLDDGVLRAAGAFEPHVKALDAIHLATCRLLGPGLTVVTHDATMVRVARALGFDVLDPMFAIRG